MSIQLYILLSDCSIALHTWEQKKGLQIVDLNWQAPPLHRIWADQEHTHPAKESPGILGNILMIKQEDNGTETVSRKQQKERGVYEFGVQWL